MAKLTIEVPTVGEKNTVAEPKVDTALKAIETWANGEVGTNNITAGTVTEAMLTTAVQEKLTTRLGFVLKKENASFEAETEKSYEQEKNGATVTLPTPTANRIISIFCTAVPACKVTASAGKIFGLFVNGQTTVELTQNQGIIVEADGSNWLIVAGEPKREAVPSALTSITEGKAEKPSATRPATVSLVIKLTGASSMEVFVGATVVAKFITQEAGTHTYSYSLPPLNAGQEWNWKQIAGTVTVEASTLLG